MKPKDVMVFCPQSIEDKPLCGNRAYFKENVLAERKQYTGSRDIYRPYSDVNGNTAKICSIRHQSAFQREKIIC